MTIEILRHTPVWVWALLAALLAFGALQLRERRVTRAQLLALPLALGTLGLTSTAASFALAPAALGAWAAAFALGFSATRRLAPPAGAAWDAARRVLRLPGSAWPLAVIVGIFALRYATGVSLALHPDWRASLAFALPQAGTTGAIGGALLGRPFGLLGARAYRPA